MLKVRLQGTTYDIKWFLRQLSRDDRFWLAEPSDILDNKIATHIIECVDAYKKKLFVDKIKVKRAEEMIGKMEKNKEKKRIC